MNWAATLTLTLMLFLLGLSYLARLELGYLLQSIGNALDITAYVQPGVDPQLVQSQVSLWTEVQAVTIVSKELAWQQLLHDLGQLAAETNALLGENPLLDGLKISVSNSQLVPQVIDRLTHLEAVDSVWYPQNLMRQLEVLQQALGRVSSIAITVLAAIAITVTYTTIRLVSLSRTTEMEIMALVGASPRWIYAPALCQGLGFGMGAVVLATILLGVSRLAVGQWLHQWHIDLAPLSLGLSPLLFALFGISVATIGTCFSLLEMRGQR
ncbi:MAG: permease-like cell division protein FtsX [Pseudanabaenaceae cyanobacterium SKYGB_i_bin29]|nr:permease-like cell division protein FtsX [Pseudanabaenaceae cyanobacterium SKYG29]MDW8422132.1 permease-like cell division protein FtsX [Pseudanabaenaceae cyanobacterium SKYGB_i_bin29]